MVRLERPPLPAIERRLRWPGTVVAVYGRDAAPFAERLAARARELGSDARTVRVELRHREGASVTGERDLAVTAAPDALLPALSSIEAHPALTVGVGLAFAAAVECELAVWIRAGESPLSLPDAERALVREARLVLEDPREGVAERLAERLVESAPRA